MLDGRINEIASIIGDRYDENLFEIQNGEVTSQRHSEFISRLMKNIFGRTAHSLDTVEYKLAAGASRTQAPPSELTIASVASAINCFGENGELKACTFEDSRKVCLASEHYDRDLWINDRERELRTVLKLSQKLDVEPDIVCFPELSYPPPSNRTYSRIEPTTYREELVNTYFDRSSYGRNRDDYEKRMIGLLNGHGEPFTFLGSFHCPFDFYNIGIIYPLGARTHTLKAEASGKYLDDHSTDNKPIQWKLSPPILYRKRFPARRLNEFTRVPSNFEFHTYSVSGLRMGVMICSDVLDANQLLNVARVNAFGTVHNKIDVIMVPSYNESPRLVSMCRELSYLARNIVVYVNANDQKVTSDEEPSPIPKSTIFVAGFEPHELQQLGAKSASILIDQVSESVGEGRVILTRLNMDQARKFCDSIAKSSKGTIGVGSGRTGVVDY